MQWTDVREKFPNQIVLVEAIETSSRNNVRTIKDMAVISRFQDNLEAWREYKHNHKKTPEKELYIFHTSKENAEVIEQFFVGVRGQA